MRRLRFLSRARLAAALSIGLAASASAQRPAPIQPLPYTRIELPNGLVAVLNEDHASPIVAVYVWYRFGSRDDKPGQIGSAHFCEHLMSEGSPNLAQQQKDFYRSIGGTSPRFAITIEDITQYYVMVPSHQLETALWVESDRMAAPLSFADSQHVAAIRPIIAQERMAGWENVPFGTATEVVMQALFGEGNPYRSSGTSPLADLPNLTAASLTEACKPYYAPNNAVIGLSGDFDTATARRWITKYFGSIPRGPTIHRTPVPAAVVAVNKRLVLEDSRVKQPVQLKFDWVGAAYKNPDRPALLALGASLSLSVFGSDGHFAANGVQPPMLGRLSKLLVQDRRLASFVIATNYDEQESGIFEITVMPRPGASLTTIETLVDSVVADLRVHPITAEEIARYNAYNGVLAATSLQPRYMRADTLSHDEVYAGDPTAYATQANAARQLTPADIARVVHEYLDKPHVVVSLVPAGRMDLIPKPELPYTNATPGAGVKP
jgi:predicted Zn-dependent peptidase